MSFYCALILYIQDAKNTNKANVVTMTEADALAQGKRHTSKE